MTILPLEKWWFWGDQVKVQLKTMGIEVRENSSF